jgi:outer membrane lipoprotein carrier protein
MSFRSVPLAVVVSAVPIAFATSLVAQPKPRTPAPSANDIATRVQKFYDKTRTYQASFVQRYHLRAYKKTKDSAGRVAFEKPGRMSWRYTNNGNRIVSDGKTVKVYEAGNKQMYEQPMAKSQYPAALAFLVGGGKLKKELTLRKLSSASFPNGHVLEGVPKTPTPAYSKLLLFVDAGTHQVRRVLLLDTQGNRNRFDFSRPVLNRKLAQSEFAFRPPAGTQVIR